MYNSPFKNKNIDNINRVEPENTSNAMMNGGPGDPPKKTSYDYGDKMPSVHINPLISGSKSSDKYKDLIQSDRYKKETRTGPVAPPKQGELGYEKGSFLGNYIRK